MIEMETISVGPKKIGYKCKQCAYYTSSEMLIHNHISDHQLGTEFNCENCTIDQFSCSECDFTTNFTILYTRHMVECHMMMELESVDDITGYTCSDCRFQTHFLLKYLKHVVGGCFIKTVDQEEPFHCGQVGTPNEQQTELKVDNKEKYSKDPETKLFHCNNCPYKSKWKTDVKRHVTRKHLADTEIKLFKCDQCNYEGKTKKGLNAHKNRHKLQCQTEMLNSHNKTNEQEGEIQWLKCDHCAYKTTLQLNLNYHVVYHHPSAVRFLRCEHCKYITKKLSKLERHRKKHLDSDELKHGESKSTSNEWYNCEFCRCKRKSQWWLQRHVKEKHGLLLEKPKLDEHWADLNVVDVRIIPL